MKLNTVSSDSVSANLNTLIGIFVRNYMYNVVLGKKEVG